MGIRFMEIGRSLLLVFWLNTPAIGTGASDAFDIAFSVLAMQYQPDRDICALETRSGCD